MAANGGKRVLETAESFEAEDLRGTGLDGRVRSWGRSPIKQRSESQLWPLESLTPAGGGVTGVVNRNMKMDMAIPRYLQLVLRIQF